MSKTEIPTIFDYMNSFFYKKGNIYNKDDKISSYMLCMWLSHDENLLPIIDKLNELLYNIPDEQVYNFLYNKIPKGRRYIKWVKKTKDDKFDPSELMEEYNISSSEAKLYRRIIK